MLLLIVLNKLRNFTLKFEKEINYRFNLLGNDEDIYLLSYDRKPANIDTIESRKFYIKVPQLPSEQIDEYVKNVIAKFKRARY